MHILPNTQIYANRGILTNFFSKLREALTPIEDQWTLTTVDGEFYEEVSVEDIKADNVTFNHKFGEARLPIVSFSEDSQTKIQQGFTTAPDSRKKRQVAPVGQLTYNTVPL